MSRYGTAGDMCDDIGGCTGCWVVDGDVDMSAEEVAALLELDVVEAEAVVAQCRRG